MAPIGWRVYGLDPEKGRLRFLGHSLVLVELLSLYSTEEEIHMWPTHINLVIQSRGSSLDATSHHISISEALSVFGGNISYAVWLLLQASIFHFSSPCRYVCGVRSRNVVWV